MAMIYFVRHGESIDNKNGIIPGDKSFLSARGKRNAIFAAKKLQKVSINLIISSNQARALQTADILAKKLKLKIIKDSCLRERKFPSEITGKREDEVFVKRVLNMMYSRSQNKRWHYSDEENFTEFKNRVRRFLRRKLCHLNKDIIIVSHAGFIRMIMCLIKYGNQASYFDYSRIRNRTKIKSGLIMRVNLNNSSLCEFRKKADSYFLPCK